MTDLRLAFYVLLSPGFSSSFQKFDNSSDISWVSYLYSLKKCSIISSKYWTDSIANTIMIIITHLLTNSWFSNLHYIVQDLVTDGADIFLNFFVTVLKLESYVPLSSKFFFSFEKGDILLHISGDSYLYSMKKCCMVSFKYCHTPFRIS